VLEAIVARIPAPRPTDESAVRALIFDSWYDVYEGVIGLVRVFGGELRVGMKVRLMGTDKLGEVIAPGAFHAARTARRDARSGRGRLRRGGNQNRGGHARRRHDYRR